MRAQDDPAVNITPKPLVNRSRGTAAEAQRDVDVLRFTGRFRFVTDELLAERFDVSRQQMNLRVRRLAAVGLLQRASGSAQRQLVSLTRKGARAIDLPLRRAPRTDAQREHELALVWLVIQLERAGGTVVRTERECRTREAEGAGHYSVPVRRADRPVEQRWTDVVLESETRRSALELELSAKGTTRLQAIVDGYAAATHFSEVVFLAADVSIGRRLARTIRDAGSPMLPAHLTRQAVRLRVVPWPGLTEEEQRAFALAVATA